MCYLLSHGSVQVVQAGILMKQYRALYDLSQSWIAVLQSQQMRLIYLVGMSKIEN